MRHSSSTLRLRADWDYDCAGGRRHYLLRAFDKGRVVGIAHGWYASGSSFVLQKIEFNPSHRSRGHGSWLIEVMRHQARRHGCRDFVFAGVRQDNVGAIRLYESLNAQPCVGDGDASGVCEFVITPP